MMTNQKLFEGGSQMGKLHKPGEDNQKPGQYIETGPLGGDLPKPKVVKIDPGDRLPPTSKPGNKWKHK